MLSGEHLMLPRCCVVSLEEYWTSKIRDQESIGPGRSRKVAKVRSDDATGKGAYMNNAGFVCMAAEIDRVHNPAAPSDGAPL